MWKYNIIKKINLKWIGFCAYRRFWANKNNIKSDNLDKTVNYSNYRKFILNGSKNNWNNFEVILGEKIFLHKIKLIKILKNGGLKSSIIIKSLKWLEKYVYNNAAAAITIDQKFYDQIINRFKDRNKLKIIPNFVDTSLYKPLSSELKFPYPFQKDPLKFRILYAGNIGFYQDWEPVLFAAKKLIDTNIEFWIIG